MNRISLVIAATVLVAALGAGDGWAAELRLRAQCSVKGTVVTLGDVAEVITADSRQAGALAAIELFPVPVASRPRFVRLREIQDLLVLRGVNLAEHRFSGSSQVTVAVAGESVRPPEPEPAVSFAATRKATSDVHDAIVQYLREHVRSDQPWMVEVELSPNEARLISNATHGFSISGGAAPWTGTQRFEVAIESPQRRGHFPLEAQVTLPPAVVVAVHSLGRGAMIRETDVELQHPTPRPNAAGAFSSLDDVIGKETTRAIPEGEILSQESLRPQLVVRRGEVVTVYARGSGIQVRTTARARDDGSVGDLIAVESLQDRSTFFARVSGILEVEVLASSIPAGEKSFGARSQVAARTPRK